MRDWSGLEAVVAAQEGHHDDWKQRRSRRVTCWRCQEEGYMGYIASKCRAVIMDMVEYDTQKQLEEQSGNESQTSNALNTEQELAEAEAVPVVIPVVSIRSVTDVTEEPGLESVAARELDLDTEESESSVKKWRNTL